MSVTQSEAVVPVAEQEPDPIYVVIVGLGNIGQSVARLIHQRDHLSLVGGVDIEPDLSGRDLGDVLGLATPLGCEVSNDLAGSLRQLSPDVAVICTSSTLNDVAHQLRVCIREGVDVVSTCEELAYKSSSNGQLWESLDAEARQGRVSILGTGVNPGFIMDALPLFTTAVSERIDRIYLHRVVDASKRRLALQRKIGAGLGLDEFRGLASAGRMGHVGLMESAIMVSSCLGWTFDEIDSSIEPCIAESVVTTPYLTVEPGQTTGVHQVIRGTKDGTTCLTLELEMYVGATESFDRIVVDGIPSLDVLLSGGIHGDIATRAITVNSIPRVAEAPPGLLAMTDIPIVFARGAV